jgi:hypothetical protein
MGKLIVAALVLGIAGVSGTAWSQAKPCEELKGEIDAKIRKNGVEKFTLEIVAPDAVKEGDGKVVGSCEGGTKRILYRRG